MKKSGITGYKNVWVFAEIQDHEKVLDGALELLTKGRELADTLGEKLCAVVLALDAEQYLPLIEKYGPDRIIYASDMNLKHYNSEIVPDIFTGLIREHRPSIVLFPSSEAGKDLAPRLARRFSTGLTSHCTGLGIIDSPQSGERLLLMKRPALNDNMIASIICPHARPQMATVQTGIFKKKEMQGGKKPELTKIDFSYDLSKLKITNLDPPVRWNPPHVPLEKATIVVAGGRGMGSRAHFDRLYELAKILGAEVGATRVPVFNKWCGEERMIGQTGKTVKPELYLAFGISGQIQHTTSIVDSRIIVSINTGPNPPIDELSDYVIKEDANKFLGKFIEKLKREKNRQQNGSPHS